MRVLLLHPDDSPWGGAWSLLQWDLIVDLGFASSYTYEEWSHRSGARVLSIYGFAGQTDSYRWVNRVLERGRGNLLDRAGLDWWEILAVWSYHDLQALYLLKQLRPEIAADPIDLAASRPHLFTKLIEQTLSRPVRYFQVDSRGLMGRVRRMMRSARQLRPAQIVEIAFDKWDPAYSVRRHLSRHNRIGLVVPPVLLPSSYCN